MRIKRFSKNNLMRQGSIAVVGAQRGVGVTGLCLALANFMHSVAGLEVLYIEVSESSEVYELVRERPVSMGDSVGYDYMGVVYVVSATYNEARKLMSQFRGIVILDLEELTEETKDIFLMAQKRICLGSVMPWKTGVFVRYVENVINRYATGVSVKFITKDKERKSKKVFETATGKTLISVANISDPFQLKEEEFQTILKIIQ